MDLKRAQTLKYGDTVRVPADPFSGTPSFIGTVRTEGLDKAPVNVSDIFGKRVEYIWIEIRRPGYHKSVWPSNRLGAI